MNDHDSELVTQATELADTAHYLAQATRPWPGAAQGDFSPLRKLTTPKQSGVMPSALSSEG
ncbi:hypothetical protein SAMN05216368_101420 [Cryobacterium flavum]|uniref:Uncharacterized protein n=1 Tax=Cryobacterium flavum TaxID=1424659 RepID=A0A4R8V682_9MICO|nr:MULTISPECIES: hypothetical protein [Cryobacterium]TFB77798.1 hypothetical protein E3O21_09140 [Cryobacterium flavum]SDM60389.1 hypothetical protein SAMN05216368_101420 [Cryobacterium flavum]